MPITDKHSSFSYLVRWDNLSKLNDLSEVENAIHTLSLETSVFLSSLAFISDNSFFDVSSRSPRTINTGANDAEVKKLQEKIREYEEQAKKGKEYQTEISALKQQVEALQRENALKQNDIETEKEWNTRIEDAFKGLNNKLDILEKDAKRANFDRWMYSILMLVVVVLAAVWMGFFISKTTSPLFEIKSILQFMPWYSPMALAIGLFWVAVVQRNKSTRHLLTINEDLFRVQYTEGLLKALNKLSPSADDGVNRISALLDELVKNYIHLSGQKETFQKFNHEKDASFGTDDIVKIIDSVAGAGKK